MQHLFFPVPNREVAKITALLTEAFLTESMSLATEAPRPEDDYVFHIWGEGDDDYQTLLRHFLENIGFQNPKITVEEIADDYDWVSENQKSFTPILVTPFFIRPSTNQETPPVDCPYVLTIDAAVAFGTGSHATTQGCLQLLQILAAEGFVPESPLDMGCGTGILAMAMAMLWQRPVLGVDNDAPSIPVAQQNARDNGLDHWVTITHGEGFCDLPSNHFDLITANILAGPLIGMAQDMAAAIQKDGKLILSGILDHQEQDVITAYEAAGFRLHRQLPLQEWRSLLMVKS